MKIDAHRENVFSSHNYGSWNSPQGNWWVQSQFLVEVTCTRHFGHVLHALTFLASQTAVTWSKPMEISKLSLPVMHPPGYLSV